MSQSSEEEYQSLINNQETEYNNYNQENYDN